MQQNHEETTKSNEEGCQGKVVWNGGDKYHVTMTVGGHEVVCDFKKKTCACRKWQLNGIPCFHARACIFFQKLNPEDFIHSCYLKKRFVQVYSHILEPINGEPYWEETQADPPMPPLKKTMPGRPKKNRDKKTYVVCLCRQGLKIHKC